MNPELTERGSITLHTIIKHHHLVLVAFLVGCVCAKASRVCTLGNEQKKHFPACFRMGLSLSIRPTTYRLDAGVPEMVLSSLSLSLPFRDQLSSKRRQHEIK